MKTLYIDIYFLINFCVDILAFYYASKMAHIKTGNLRLMVLGTVGGISAVIHILGGRTVVTVANIVLSLLLLMLIGAKGASIFRRLKFLLLFLIIQLLIGGCVSFGYGLLDRYVSPLISNIDDSVANRRALIFAALVLFSIFVIRLIILLFTSRATERTVGLILELDSKKYECEAFVDSGNLVREPMSQAPVIFVGGEAVRRMKLQIGSALEEIDGLKEEYKRRIKLIPITNGSKTQILVGMKLDTVRVKCENRTEEVDAIVVFNKEEKTYAGYDSLVPSCLINEI